MRLSSEEFKVLTDRVQAVLGELMEHCECVQILASAQSEDGGTAAVIAGNGNFYGRIGLAHEFLSRDQAESIGAAVADNQPEGEE